MTTLLVRHTVKDYAKWKSVVDETKPMARSMGVKSQRILRNSADPNEVVILNEFDDINKARQFANSDELKQAMQRAGVVDTPSIYFLNEADRIIL